MQVAVLSISEKFKDYANEVVEKLRAAGLRVEANLGAEKIGAKIRDASMQKIPYMLIVGEQEQQQKKVAVRHRIEGDRGALGLNEFIQRCLQEVATRGAALATK